MHPLLIVHYGCPLLLTASWQSNAFLLAPGLLALLGALLGQGSFLRIATAALGAALRDLAVLALVQGGWLTVTNPVYDFSFSVVLAFGCASGAALLATLSPYRGKRLLLLSGLGGLLGQFLLPLVIGRSWRGRGQEYQRIA